MQTIDITDLNADSLALLLDNAADIVEFSDPVTTLVTTTTKTTVTVVSIERETEKALLIYGDWHFGIPLRTGGGGTMREARMEAWVPKSQLEKLEHDGETVYLLPNWLGKKLAIAHRKSFRQFP